MQQPDSFKIFFGLPASVRCGNTVASQHLCCKKKMQLKRSLYKYVLVFAVACLFITQKTNAQVEDSIDVVDSTIIDTVSMHHVNESPSGYDDNDDGYEDTSVKHIYDTSQYFFNWKEYLDDAYTKDKIKPRHAIDTEVKSLKSQDDFWYIPAIEKMETRIQNDPKYRDSLLNAKNRQLRDERGNDLSIQPWVATLIWVLTIVVFVGALIYFLAQNKISFFSKESASANNEETENEEEDIFHISYSKLIQKAEKENDFRVAIRLMFLQTLKLLSDTNAIQYQPDYTNLHYLQQLYQSKYYTEFSKVSRSYEYAWYGKFYISQERYTTIKNDFIKLQNKIT